MNERKKFQQKSFGYGKPNYIQEIKKENKISSTEKL